MMDDEELDFEEEDFSNVDSLLYAEEERDEETSRTEDTVENDINEAVDETNDLPEETNEDENDSKDEEIPVKPIEDEDSSSWGSDSDQSTKDKIEGNKTLDKPKDDTNKSIEEEEDSSWDSDSDQEVPPKPEDCQKESIETNETTIPLNPAIEVEEDLSWDTDSDKSSKDKDQVKEVPPKPKDCQKQSNETNETTLLNPSHIIDNLENFLESLHSNPAPIPVKNNIDKDLEERSKETKNKSEIINKKSKESPKSVSINNNFVQTKPKTTIAEKSQSVPNLIIKKSSTQPKINRVLEEKSKEVNNKSDTSKVSVLPQNKTQTTIPDTTKIADKSKSVPNRDISKTSLTIGSSTQPKPNRILEEKPKETKNKSDINKTSKESPKSVNIDNSSVQTKPKTTIAEKSQSVPNLVISKSSTQQKTNRVLEEQSKEVKNKSDTSKVRDLAQNKTQTTISDTTKIADRPESVPTQVNDIANTLQIPFNKRKTVELDQKYYNSIKIYLTKGKVIGYPEEAFRVEAKHFKMKGEKLFMGSKEVIESDERQRAIAQEFHLNKKAKRWQSMHRSVSTTIKAIETKYFWGTIKFDVENVLDKCEICHRSEDEESETSETNTPKQKTPNAFRELQRLQIDSKLFNYSDMKRKQNKSNNQNDSKPKKNDSSDSDESSSNTSSRRSASFIRRRRSSSESKSRSNCRPFREKLRASNSTRASVETVDLEDSSRESIISSQIGSADSVGFDGKDRERPKPLIDGSNERITDLEKYDINGICQPCVVLLTNPSQQYIDDAINGSISFIDKKCKSKQTSGQNNVIVVSDDSTRSLASSPEAVAVDHHKKSNQKVKIVSSVEKPIQENKSIKKTEKKMSYTLNLSESSSEEEEREPKESPKKPTSSLPSMPRLSALKATPDRSSTQLKSQKTIANKSQPKRKRKQSSSEDSDYEENDDSKDEDSDYRKDNNSERSSNSKKQKTDIRSKIKAKLPEKEQQIQSSKTQIIRASSQSSDLSEKSNKSEKRRRKTDEMNVSLEVLKCQFCDFQTNKKQDLIMHSAYHKKDDRQKVLCDICLQTFYNEKLLKQHKEEVHPPDLKNVILYGCQLCKGLQFDSIASIDEHLKTHVEDISFMKTTSKHRCAVCKTFTSVNLESMSNHLSQKHRSFKCAFDCDFLSSDYISLERHAKSNHPIFCSPFECKFCEYGSTVFGALTQHINKEHTIEWMADGNIKCSLCESRFAFESDSIVDHLMDHSMDFENYLECSNCAKRCRRLEQMKRHLNTHHGVGPADGFRGYISNLKNLFDDIRKQKDQSRPKQSTSQEADSAVMGLLTEQFVDEEEYIEPFQDEVSTDPLTAALAVAGIDTNGQPDPYGSEDQVPTISLPENGDEYGYIQEDEEGEWLPVDQQTEESQ